VFIAAGHIRVLSRAPDRRVQRIPGIPTSRLSVDNANDLCMIGRNGLQYQDSSYCVMDSFKLYIFTNLSFFRPWRYRFVRAILRKGRKGQLVRTRTSQERLARVTYNISSIVKCLNVPILRSIRSRSYIASPSISSDHRWFAEGRDILIGN